MRAIKIDVASQTISEVSINDWREIAPAIGNGCEYFSCPVVLENEDTIYVDDEGLFHEITGGFLMPNFSYPLIGNAIILGTNDEGESVDAKSTLEYIRANVRFVTKQAAEDWAQNSRGFTIVSF